MNPDLCGRCCLGRQPSAVSCQVEEVEVLPDELEPEPEPEPEPELAAGAEAGVVAGFEGLSFDPDVLSVEPAPDASDEPDELVSAFVEAGMVDSLDPDEDPLPERLSVL